MISEHWLRERCSKAIATQLSKRAQDYVTEDMVKCLEKLTEVQADFRQLVEGAAHQMMKQR